jgi:hypothetical protein
MSLKRWMLGKVNDTTTSRGHARRIAPSLGDEAPAGDDPREPAMGRSRDGTRDAVHLGPYGPLIGAIRDELEHFVASQLRLHLAIAEHDRYVLTSIEVECADDEAQRALLRRFVTEFKPEQIKQYLARDVIAGLRNASAIDLSQFAGLNAQQPPEDDDDDPYQDLIADLQKSAPSGRARGFEVALLGRWSQTDVPTRSHARSTHPARGTTQGASTPLAGRTFALDVEDTAGTRRVELTAIVPGQRYTVGKDPGCDVTVDARYASRRHCELWFEHGTWWVADAGSTNGIRVDANDEAGGAEHLRREGDALELPAGATLVLSAAARGEAALYPRLTLHAAPAFHLDVRDTAATDAPVPVTPIAPPRRRQAGWCIAARMASGVRDATIGTTLPFGVGRSRNQSLVIDWAHAEVSGRHLDIVAVDENGASVVVHGDNGVSVDGTAYARGARFQWKPGETLCLGAGDEAAAACTLVLSHHD